MDKQTAGFKFGRYGLTVLRQCGHVEIDGRCYKLVYVQTNDGSYYYSLRLYNARGRFIKQLLFEPSILAQLARLLLHEAGKKRG